MRCLVTGVAGFIGSHVAERLIADGHEVLGVDAFTDYYSHTIKESNLQTLRQSTSFHFLKGDLNALDLPEVVADCDWIFHQAAQAGVRASWGKTFSTYTACNISATQLLLEAAVTSTRLQRFVYASSSSVYGDAPALPVTEDSVPRPVSPYGVTKLAGEHLCLLYWRAYRVPTVALRYFSVYGPRQRPDMAFHRFGKAILEGSPIHIFGDGEQTRDFTYVDDVVEANVQSAEAPEAVGEVFNIAGGSRVTLREVLTLLESLIGCRAQTLFKPAQRGDARDTFADITHARRLLGYSPRIALRDGLSEQVKYLRRLYAIA